MTDLETLIGSLLIDLEAELRRMQLWSDVAPPADALLSQQPFCIDTLNFDQWLQFIFLPTLHQLLENGEPLPEQCGVAPMAEEYFTANTPGAAGGVIACLQRIDELLSEPREPQPGA